jgi:cell division protein FtsQ
MSGRRGSGRNVRKARARDQLLSPRSRRLLSAVLLACGVAVAVLAVGSGGPATWAWCKAHPYFAVREVSVTGHARLTRQDVMAWVGVRPGTSVWDAVPGHVAVRLRQHPWVEDAVVERRFPGSVRIKLTERSPVAIVRLEHLYYVDEEGNLLGALRDADSKDFPFITGLEEEDAGKFAPVALHRAARVLRRCVETGWIDSVSEIHVERRRGVTVFPVHLAVPIVLGWGDWGEKLERAARALAAWEGRETELLQVDASFRDLIIVRLRDGRDPAEALSASKGIRV